MPHHYMRNILRQSLRDNCLNYYCEMNTLAERLLWARKKKGLTQATLARLSGSSQPAIGSLESGNRVASRNIAAIAAALGVNAMWLQTGKGRPDLNYVEPVEVVKQYSADIQLVIELMLSTDERGQKKILLAAQDTLDMHRALQSSMPRAASHDDVAALARRLSAESLAVVNKSEQLASDGHKTEPVLTKRKNRQH